MKSFLTMFVPITNFTLAKLPKVYPPLTYAFLCTIFEVGSNPSLINDDAFTCMYWFMFFLFSVWTSSDGKSLSQEEGCVKVGIVWPFKKNISYIWLSESFLEFSPTKLWLLFPMVLPHKAPLILQILFKSTCMSPWLNMKFPGKMLSVANCFFSWYLFYLI